MFSCYHNWLYHLLVDWSLVVLAMSATHNYGRVLTVGTERSDSLCILRVALSTWFGDRMQRRRELLALRPPVQTPISPVESTNADFGPFSDSYNYDCIDTILPPPHDEIASAGKFIHVCNEGLIPTVKLSKSLRSGLEGPQSESISYWKAACVALLSPQHLDVRVSERECLDMLASIGFPSSLLVWTTHLNKAQPAQDLTITKKGTLHTHRSHDHKTARWDNLEENHVYVACATAPSRDIVLNTAFTMASV